MSATVVAETSVLATIGGSAKCVGKARLEVAASTLTSTRHIGGSPVKNSPRRAADLFPQTWLLDLSVFRSP